MTNVQSIPSPSIHTEDRAHEADHPTSQVAKFGMDQPLKLDCGIDLAPFQIAYQTYGELNADRSNAILICHALTRDQHVANVHPLTGKPGWWEIMVGPGRPLDTDRYFIICCERDRRLHGLDRSGLDQSGHRQGVGAGFSRHHHSRHGARAGHAARPAGDRNTVLRGRRLDGRHAGAAMDRGLSRARVLGAAGRLLDAPFGAEHRVPRTRPSGRDGRSGLAAAGAISNDGTHPHRGLGRGADGRAHHLSLRRRAASQVRAADAGPRAADLLVRRGFPGRKLSALSRLVLCRALRRQQLSLSDAGDGLFRYRRRP